MDDEEETEEDKGFSFSSSGIVDESRKCYLVTGPEEDDDEEDEWDEGNSFSDNAMQILDDLKAGVVAEDLKGRLRIPRNSSNRKAMMTIFKLIEKINEISFNKSTRPGSSLLNRTPSPCPVHNSQIFGATSGKGFPNQSSSSSPAARIGGVGNHTTLNGSVPTVPQLDLTDMLPNGSPQPTYQNAVVVRPQLMTVPKSAHSCFCPNCRNYRNHVGISDFIYLVTFGIGTALIFYYLYSPRLYEGPVI